MGLVMRTNMSFENGFVQPGVTMPKVGNVLRWSFCTLYKPMLEN